MPRECIEKLHNNRLTFFVAVEYSPRHYNRVIIRACWKTLPYFIHITSSANTLDKNMTCVPLSCNNVFNHTRWPFEHTVVDARTFRIPLRKTCVGDFFLLSLFPPKIRCTYVGDTSIACLQSTSLYLMNGKPSNIIIYYDTVCIHNIIIYIYSRTRVLIESEKRCYEYVFVFVYNIILYYSSSWNVRASSVIPVLYIILLD